MNVGPLARTRADYLDRGLTPHLLAISKDGLRAKSMQPVFPVRLLCLSWVVHTHGMTDAYIPVCCSPRYNSPPPELTMNALEVITGL